MCLALPSPKSILPFNFALPVPVIWSREPGKRLPAADNMNAEALNYLLPIVTAIGSHFLVFNHRLNNTFIEDITLNLKTHVVKK
jgi:hypothetical protein